MERISLWRRALSFPASRPGRWSLVLAAGFVVLLWLFFALVRSGQRGGDTFFSNPWLAWTVLAAAGCALAGGVAASLAVARRKDRSIFLLLPLCVAGVVLLFIAGEMGGH